MKAGLMLTTLAILVSCGRTATPTSTSREIALMYVAALEVDSLKKVYDTPDRYPDAALDAIGQPYAIGASEFKGTLKRLADLPEEKARFDSMVRTAIDEATIRSINEKDSVNKE